MAWGSKSRHERGYGAAWVKVRRLVLERDHGLCQPCKRAGKTTIGAAVDHIVSKANAARLRWAPGRVDHPDNLQTICEPCHLVKTEAEQGKTKRVRKSPGEDGWPV